MQGSLAKLRFGWSFATVLTLSLVLAITGMVALITWLDIRRERAIFRAEVTNRGTFLAGSLNDVLANYIYFSQIDALRDIAEVVKSHPDVSYVQIFMPDGRPLVGTQRDEYPVGFTDHEFTSRVIQEMNTTLTFKGDRLEVTSPIEIGPEVLGAVQFGFNADTLRAEIRQLVLQHVWQGLILIGVGVAISYLIARYTNRPLRTLSDAAGEIGRGNLRAPIKVSGLKEIASVGNALEHMRLELGALYQGLEQQVADRTRALFSSNEGLRREVEERKRAEETLARQAVQLEAANAELETFSYSVSHDLRSPLMAIDGFSQALLEDYSDALDSNGKDYLQRVRGASQRMAQLIDALLKLARMTRTELSRQIVELNVLAYTVAAELQKTQSDRHVDFIIAEGLLAEGDPRLLRVLTANLMGNAWKFTRDCSRPVIEFGVTRLDGKSAFFVRDNGAGFDMAYSDRLFSPFQRLRSPDEVEGIGIGLATVQRIVHRHGGHIRAEGSVGRGATFYFTLS